MTSKLLTRLGLLAVGAAALGACDYTLLVTPDLADPGDEITVSNADGPYCADGEGEGEEAPPPAEGLPVSVVVLTDDLSEPGDLQFSTAVTDENGLFETTVVAPERPGQHVVLAICGGLPEDVDIESVRTAAADDPPTSSLIFSSLRVRQQPLTIELSDDEVTPGSEVTATFNRCQAENDFGIFTDVKPIEEEGDPATDYPDLEVFLDGELIETVLGEERYPQGTVEVPVTLEELGDHEIAGVCTYQTFALDLSQIVSEGPGDAVILQAQSVRGAAVDYPLTEGPITLDEDTTAAAATVRVVAPAALPRQVEAPVVEPTYAG